MNSVTGRKPSNLYTLSKEDLNSFSKSAYEKVRNDLKNKYSQVIRDKNYDIKQFEKTLKKEVDEFNYLNYPKYNEMFHKIEKKFLRCITTYDDINRKLLSKDNVRKIINQEHYYFNKGNNYKQPVPIKHRSNPNKNKSKKEIEAEKDIWRLANQKCKEEVEIKSRLRLKDVEKDIKEKQEIINSQRGPIKTLIDDKIKESLI